MMDSSIEYASQQLCQALFDLILPLQTTKQIDKGLFEKADEAARIFAKVLKGKDNLPRVPFKELYSAARVLEAEADYSRDPALLKDMALKLQATAELVIWGECHEDHQPGVPRIK